VRHAVQVVLVAMLAVACGARSATPPEIVVDRTACQHCGMLISDRRYAAAVRTAEGDRVFDDIGCLINALKGRAPDGATFWFNDATSADWITGTPVFVASAAFRTPMSGGVLAYGDRAAAERAAATHQGTIVSSLDALLARAGGK
jgi:copper chaperone NosL